LYNPLKIIVKLLDLASKPGTGYIHFYKDVNRESGGATDDPRRSGTVF
jgi:hypothetical protein